MSELIYGSLKPLANVGQAGIKTSGAYQEPVARVNHAEKLMKEVRRTGRFGGDGSGRGAGSTIPTAQINVAKVVRLMKEQKFTHRGLYNKTGLSNTAFDNALRGKTVWITTIEKIANALGLTGTEVMK